MTELRDEMFIGAVEKSCAGAQLLGREDLPQGWFQTPFCSLRRDSRQYALARRERECRCARAGLREADSHSREWLLGRLSTLVRPGFPGGLAARTHSPADACIPCRANGSRW
jgi:hypothetical protein